jgi:DNA-binding protein H-NS
MPAQVNLRTMSLDKLMKLKDDVERTLASKLADERRHLEAELGRLSRFSSGTRSAGFRGSSKGQTIAPKYRNPENPLETWAGRGLKPRWLTTAIKAGHKLEDFAIDGKGGTGRATNRRAAKGAGPRGRSSMRGSTVAPKYRNPDNPAETWAGRGLKPRWLTEALKKSGKKLEHFAITARAKTTAVKRSRRTGR